jgi:hypothetical protein
VKRFAPLLATTALVIAGCSPQAADEPTTTPAPPQSSTTTTTETERPDCLAGALPFAEQGIAAALDSPQHDATTIGGIRWQPEDGCERVLLEFLAEGGSPATRLGPVGVTVARDSGVVRVSLPDEVEFSAIGDSKIGGTLVDHIYVVDGIQEDGLVVDLHLASRAAARAFTTTSPSRLVIDLRPAEESSIGSSPGTGSSIVVSNPLPGPGLYPLQVSGYAAPDVNSVQVAMLVDGTVAVERSTSTTGEQHLWRFFGLTITDGPSGPVELQVAADGSGDPAIVELDLP